MCAPSPRPSGERIQGEGGRLHAYDALLQATVSGLQGEDRQEFAAEQEPLTLDPLPGRAGTGSTHRDHLIKRNQFSRQFCLMRPMLSHGRGPCPSATVCPHLDQSPALAQQPTTFPRAEWS